MNDNVLSNGDYYRIVDTLKNRESMLSEGSLSPADQRDTSGLIRALNPTFNPSGSNVPFINSLKNRLER